MSFINLLPALGFLILNVFVPGPNVLNTIATAIGSGYRTGLACALACGVGILLCEQRVADIGDVAEPGR